MLEVILKHHDGIEGEGTADEGAHGESLKWRTAGIIRRPGVRFSRKLHAPDSAASSGAAMLRA
jgi:hypothetical protein